MFYDFNLYSCRLGREDRATSSNHLHDPRLLAIAAVDHQVLEAQHDDYVHSSISGTAFFRFSALLVSIFLSSLVKIFYASYQLNIVAFFILSVLVHFLFLVVLRI